MSVDKTYQKQLEAFGIESVRVTEGDAERHRQERDREALLAVVKHVMETIEGRQYFYSKLEMCRVFTSPFIPGAPDGTAFFSGVQSVGQSILDDIMRASPANFFLMIQEAEARKKPA